MKTNEPKFQAGQTLFYDDGYPSKRGECVVLEVSDWLMVVQFSDRADTTAIKLNDRSWTDHLTVKP